MTESRLSEIIMGTPVTTDPAGYAWTLNGDVSASGMFLAPGWVITAGHFMADNDGAGRSSFASPPLASAEIGTTTSGSWGTPFVHPRWWGALGHPPPPLGLRDWAYDVGLLRLFNPLDGSAYPSKLYNQLSNSPAGSAVRCYGYGQTALNGTGGGPGMLQTALFPVTGYEINPGQTLPDPVGPSSVPMITVGDSDTGQRLFHGDSGGTCRNEMGSPYLIAGIAESYKDHPDGTHTTYLVDPWNIKYWVDQTMHSAVETIPTAVPGFPVAFTSASTKTNANRRNYVVATTTSNVPYLNQYRPDGWSGWFALPAIPPNLGFPHRAVHQNVGLTAVRDSAGEPRLWMAVASRGDLELTNTMYVSPNLILGTTTPWDTFTWTAAGTPPAGKGFKGNPAIVTAGTISVDRVDYFSYASNNADDNGAIVYRWKFNGAWQNSAWQELPSPVGLTIKSSPSVALRGNTYYLAARASDNHIWMMTLPNVTNSSTYGGPWTAWVQMPGTFQGSPAVTAWERGVDLYAVGVDNTLYHQYMDAEGVWSDLIHLDAITFTSTTALTASNLLPSIHEINVIGMAAGSPASPRITRYAW
jgi:hypothetical protein